MAWMNAGLIPQERWMAEDGFVLQRRTLSSQLEVKACAEALRISCLEASQLCMKFWAWAETQTSDGLLQGIRLHATIDREVGTDGFAQALIDAGWLRLTAQGFSIPEWGVWLGDAAKIRALDRLRQKRRRSTRDKHGGKSSGVSSGRLSGVGGTIGGVDPSSESFCLGGKKKDPLSGNTEFELPFKSTEFALAWENWLEYRRKRSLPKYKTDGQLKRVAKWGEPRAIAAIEYSIAQNYEGIFEEKGNGRGSTGNRIGPGQRYDESTAKDSAIGDL